MSREINEEKSYTNTMTEIAQVGKVRSYGENLVLEILVRFLKNLENVEVFT